MGTGTITRRRLLGGAAALVGAAASASACGGEQPRRAGGSRLEKVAVLTGAGFQGREAPLLVAQAQGWFGDEGLDVEVLPGKGSGENLKLLVAGKVDIATLDVNAALIEASKGGPLSDIRLTSVLHQRNLACFVALAASGISTPRDLAGKRLSFLPGGINYLLFPTYAKLAGFDAGTVTWVANPVPAHHSALLASRRVDAISQFIPAVDSVRSIAETNVTVLPFVDLIGDLHGSAMAVTTATAERRADIVRRFNRALLEGLRYAIEQPQAAGTIYAAQKQTQGQQAAAATSELQAMEGYVRPGGGGRLGHFDLARVARNTAILQGAGTITSGLTPDSIIAPDLVE